MADESTNEIVGSFTFKAFFAVDDKEASLRFQNGHTQVLIDAGITNLTSNEPIWIHDPNVLVLSIYDHNDDVVGGLRVQRFDGTHSLPIIDALEDQVPEINSVFQETLPNGTAEICGLWSAKKVFGKGLSPVLCRCSVQMVSTLNLLDFYCLSAPYTEKMIKSMGCVVFHKNEQEWRFPYPTEKFMSAVLYCPDITTLDFADSTNKERIFSLMRDPIQEFIEPGPRGSLEIRFELLPSKVLPKS